MAHAQTLDVQDSNNTLKDNLSSYYFELEKGVIVGDPTIEGRNINFFVRNDQGQERDLTLNTDIKAREGHEISVLYASKNNNDFATAIAWVNHTTGKVDYLQDNIYDVTGDKLTKIMFMLSGGLLNLMSDMSDRFGVLMNLIIIIPMAIISLCVSLGFFTIGSLFGLGAVKTANNIRQRAQEIIVELDPKYAAYNKKRPFILSLIKWSAIGFVGLYALSLVLALFGIK